MTYLDTKFNTNNMDKKSFLLGSHNSWSYLRPRRWWMRLLRFTAQCQKYDIYNQYRAGVRCFDLRLRFRCGALTITHGAIEYDYNETLLAEDLLFLNGLSDKVYIRVCFDVRNIADNNTNEAREFAKFCLLLERTYPKIAFYGGDNLLPKENRFREYFFRSEGPTCDEKYASVCPPRILDDWFPWLYARMHNKKHLREGTDKEVLMLDFVNI